MQLDESTVALSPPWPRRSLWRGAVLGRLSRIRSGTLLVEDRDGAAQLGRPAADGLSARIAVRDPRFWRRAALGGSVGAGESYADGDWETDDLTAVVRVLARNQDALAGLERGLAWIRRPADAAFAALRRNTRAGSRRNIADHYDLGNDFFALMLDPTLTYSSAVFDPPEATLEEASLRKLDLMSARLELRPGDHLLEIGTGWGSMALHAASRYGCRVTTTTISRAQWELARERVARAGLADRVTVLLSDYRDLSGRYDEIVSIEMIEAIGAEQYRTFFRRCAELLAPGGRLAIQAITMADRHYERARREVDFIKRHVFPGSCIPSITALLTAATRSSDLRLRQLEDYGLHYARTLATWRENLESRRAQLERITDERFRRLWRFYLCYCEGGFHERHVSVVQMLFARGAEG
ncbi:MAG TPA: cyclopropane-fatty-acyl-phospholipid synthase family protein [Anaeromyxobacteraceae bacterium]|nr:cyclopropane-fatty-acyl-phospholipid synthase family protein [Anaeromyxobacteraceae bacterium]